MLVKDLQAAVVIAGWGELLGVGLVQHQYFAETQRLVRRQHAPQVALAQVMPQGLPALGGGDLNRQKDQVAHAAQGAGGMARRWGNSTKGRCWGMYRRYKRISGFSQ